MIEKISQKIQDLFFNNKEYNEIPEIKEVMFEVLLERVEDYCMLFLSRIKDNPKKRYIDLLENQPEIIKRILQQYIASYIGITPISLSRIKKKIHFS